MRLWYWRAFGYPISNKPHLDDHALAYFEAKLRSCRFYLEYGAGGSTVCAALAGKPFITVDSDRYLLGDVKKRIDALTTADARYIACDVGPVGSWGAPLLKTSTVMQRWPLYSAAPWGAVRAAGVQPDLVFVDGRFRVACVLSVLQHLQDRVDYEILLDDYEGRPYYSIVNKFAELKSLHGRMAVFAPKAHDREDLAQTLRSVETDWR